MDTDFADELRFATHGGVGRSHGRLRRGGGSIVRGKELLTAGPNASWAAKPFHVLIENTRTGRNVYFVEATDDKPSFESALTQLETIVEAMESGDVPLAELLAKFEEGNKLLKVCESRLKDAELKIELLKKQKEGVAFTKFETTGDV